MTAKDATLRRIAIVLASLPQPVSQKLLGSLQTDMRTQVKVALQQLTDVDPLERRRALDGFARSLKQPPGSSLNNSDAAEIVFSRAALNARDQVEAAQPSAKTSDFNQNSPFAFLQHVDDAQLMTHLISERPQTLAIILASVPPSLAARLLPRFDLRVRAEAMRRIASLKEIPAELVEEIAGHLRANLQQSSVSFSSTPGSTNSSDPGQRALNAILAQMSDEAPSNANLSRITPGRVTASPVHPHVIKSSESSKPVDALKPSVDSTASVLDRRSADEVDSFLVRLKPEQLRDALGSVDTQTALLALCGLPRHSADAVLSLLPRKQAKQVREQLASLLSIELREVDQAKETVAMVARRSVRPSAVPRYQAAAA